MTRKADQMAEDVVVLQTELEKVAGDLGGGWRMEHGVMPMVVLTLAEAKHVQGRIEQRHENEQVRRLRDDGRCPVCGADG